MTTPPPLQGLPVRAGATIGVIGAVLAGTLLAPSTSLPGAAAATGELAPGQTLVSGAQLRSPDGRYRLAMQSDGNAVLYSAHRAVWSSGTAGRPGARMVLQTDGNLVVYLRDAALWSSRTRGATPTRLAVQSDGNLVLYSSTGAAWASGKDYNPNGSTLRAGQSLTPGYWLGSPNGQYRLSLSGTGNLYLTGPGRLPVWQSLTLRTGSSRLVMQGDGNLVLGASDTPVWWTNTAGRTGSRLVVQDDGNLVVYSSTGAPVWNSRKPAFNSVVRPLTAAERSAMTPSVWRPGCPVPLTSLRRVSVPYRTFDGGTATGVIDVRADRVSDTVAMFSTMYTAGFPLRKMVPIEEYGGSDAASMADDNSSAFNCRAVTGGTSFSPHSYGAAIDLNPIENPYVRGTTVEPSAGGAYLNRSAVRPGMLVAGDRVVSGFEARGWTWGGRWTSLKDYQHVEKR